MDGDPNQEISVQKLCFSTKSRIPIFFLWLINGLIGSFLAFYSALGLWLMAQGSWLMTHGSWLMTHGLWLMAKAIN